MDKVITFMQQPMRIACDERCNKAWGRNARPRVEVDGDLQWMSDDELGTAPVHSGTTEGEDAKPINKAEFGNKWCVRQCERCACSRMGESHLPVEFPDFTKRNFL